MIDIVPTMLEAARLASHWGNVNSLRAVVIERDKAPQDVLDALDELADAGGDLRPVWRELGLKHEFHIQDVFETDGHSTWQSFASATLKVTWASGSPLRLTMQNAVRESSSPFFSKYSCLPAHFGCDWQMARSVSP